MILTYFLVFLSGIALEAICIFWIHYSETNQIGKAVLFSMLFALAQIVGIGESVKNIEIAPFLIVGYGVGTAIAIKLKKILNLKEK